MSLDQPIAICCSNCGGRKVRADAYAAWCDELQMWELASVFDQRFCEDCGHEVDTYELSLGHQSGEQAR